jgi:hypothetical protein
MVGKPRDKFTRLDEFFSVLQQKEQRGPQDGASNAHMPETAVQN